MKDDIVVGLDLGGTKILAAIVDRSGQILERRMTPTPANEGPTAVVQRINDLLRSCLMGPLGRNVAGIGLCAPGPLDSHTGVVLAPPNLSGWKGIPLRGLVEEGFRLPTTIEKDANAQALGELRFGAGQGHHQVVFVTAGTGIGGALIVDGRPVRGTGLAGEIGHIVIVADGPLCSCGGHGCLEVLASGLAIARTAEAAVNQSDESLLATHLREATDLAAAAVHLAAEKGDLVADRVIRGAGRYLGLGLASLINMMAPEIVIVGGGLTAFGDRYLGPAWKAAEEHSYVQRLRPAALAVGVLGDAAGAIGAAAVAFDHLEMRS